ncbi:hypothetical protein ACVWZ4_001357 [Bradyrhizobium sp. USDA 4472]
MKGDLFEYPRLWSQTIWSTSSLRLETTTAIGATERVCLRGAACPYAGPPKRLPLVEEVTLWAAPLQFLLDRELKGGMNLDER